MKSVVFLVVLFSLSTTTMDSDSELSLQITIMDGRSQVFGTTGQNSNYLKILKERNGRDVGPSAIPS
jgi:hypothetical protein